MLNGDLWSKYEKELSALFEELVPPMGKCESKAGELVRAVNRIIYRFFNDGDHIGVGYGKETCNPAARFLHCEGSENLQKVIEYLWGERDEDEYEALLDDLGAAVIEMLEEHPELRNEPTKDMFDYYDRNEDVDDEDWEEEEYDEEDDDEEDDEDW